MRKRRLLDEWRALGARAQPCRVARASRPPTSGRWRLARRLLHLPPAQYTEFSSAVALVSVPPSRFELAPSASSRRHRRARMLRLDALGGVDRLGARCCRAPRAAPPRCRCGDVGAPPRRGRVGGAASPGRLGGMPAPPASSSLRRSSRHPAQPPLAATPARRRRARRRRPGGADRRRARALHVAAPRLRRRRARQLSSGMPRRGSCRRRRHPLGARRHVGLAPRRRLHASAAPLLASPAAAAAAAACDRAGGAAVLVAPRARPRALVAALCVGWAGFHVGVAAAMPAVRHLPSTIVYLTLCAWAQPRGGGGGRRRRR